jgi:hypothetical protein
MKSSLLGLAALGLVAVGAAQATDIVYKPIDTSKYVVQPSKATANLAGQAISSVGQATASAIENNGYVKTINNVFSKKIVVPNLQTGPSALPGPTMFRSTYYRNYNTPVKPR